MQILNKAEIEHRIDLEQATAAIENAYRSASAGGVELPPVGHITFPAVDGDCHIKYGHNRTDTFWVVKVATGFPHNAAEVAPVNNGISLVLSAETGQVLAVLHDEGLLTDVRTGVGGAIASRELARGDAASLLIVGTGIQAVHQIQAHRALLTQDLDVVVWGRSADRAARVAQQCSGVTVVPDLEAACHGADIIVTVTAAREPVIRDAWIGPGVHITAVGADAPGKHELDPALVARADVVVADSRGQCFDHGELSVLPAGSPALELGEVLAGQPGRTGTGQITIADLTGIAAQDIAIASTVIDL